jgi:phosphatidate cytidylyltransferase
MAHLKRWLTALIAIPILIYLIGFGPRWLFYFLLFGASCICLHEFFLLTAPKLPRIPKALAFVLCFLFPVLFSHGFIQLAFVTLCFTVMLVLCFYLFSEPGRRKEVFEGTAAVALGFLYAGLPLSLLVLVGQTSRGNLWIFFLLAIIFLGDTAALYCGRLLGKHKLYVTVSPGKTWEGAVGGFVTSVVVGIVFSRIFDLHDSVWTIAMVSGVLAIAGQLGDLAESMIKRNYGVKDSGRILPGHGGFLDRVDALLFAIPVFYAFLTWSIR